MSRFRSAARPYRVASILPDRVKPQIGDHGRDGIEIKASQAADRTFEEETEIDVAAVEKEIERLEGELIEVRAKMKQYLKELGV